MTLQDKIIKELGVKPVIDPKEEIRVSVDFLKDYLKKYPFIKSFVLGISGGQDSTLTGKLCQMAIEEMREETGDDSYQFIAVRLPYGVQVDAKEISEADRDVHQKSLELLRISLVALNAIGKPKTVPTDKIIELRKAGNTQENIAHQLGISLSTVRRELKANIKNEP